MRLKQYLSRNFPSHRQHTSYSCGASIVVSLLVYFGIDRYESDIMDKLKSNNDDGTNYRNIIKLLKSHGLKTKAKQMTIDELVSYVEDSVPVILVLQAWGDKKDYSSDYTNGHYVIAVGVDGDKILFSDPSISEKRNYLTKSELLERWHDIDEKTNTKLIQYGIAVVGTPKWDYDKLEKMN